MASEEKPLVVVTCTAPVNIAVIKYCECLTGARDTVYGARTGDRVHAGGPPRMEGRGTGSTGDVHLWDGGQGPRGTSTRA